MPTPKAEAMRVLVDAWAGAVREREQAKRAVNRAECACMNAAAALGRAMSPDDAKAGEEFLVWCGDTLLALKVVHPRRSREAGGEFLVSVRCGGEELRLWG